MKKLFSIFLLLFSLNSWAQEPVPLDQAFHLSASNQDNQTVIFTWQIMPGHYLYAERFRFQLLDPTDAQFGKPIMPHGIKKYDIELGHYEVFEGQLKIAVPIISANPLTKVTAQVTYQGCSAHNYCYPPATKLVKLNMSALHQPAVISDVAISNVSNQDRISQFLENKGLLLIIIGFIGFGLLLSFTPCVLPMIPILSGIILGQHQHFSMWKAFRLSLTYILSMSFTYAITGILVGYLGSTIQATLQKPWVIVVFSLLFVLMALSLFGFFNLQLPQRFEGFLARISGRQTKGSYIGVAMMGCLGTLILSPCVTPPLIGVLSYIGQTGNAVLGGVALFAMGMGMGIPLLIIVTFGAKFLPKTGRWMVIIKNILGVLLLAVAIWMLSRIIPDAFAMVLWALLLIISAVYMGAFSRGLKNKWERLWQGLGIGFLAYGVLLIIGAAQGNSNPLLPLQKNASNNKQSFTWQSIKTVADLDKALATAKIQQRPILLDYFADWCISCHIIDRYTFTDADVQAALKSFILLRADITANDADAKALMKRFNIIAPPMILLFKADNQLAPAARIVGEVKAKELLESIRQVTP